MDSVVEAFRNKILFWNFKKNSAHTFRQLVSENPVLANVQRLLDDSDLLYRNRRYASATALAVIALEEVGKYLLEKWEQQPPDSWQANSRNFTYDKKKFHQTKQAAVVALFTAGAVRAKYIKKKVNFANLNKEEVLKLAEAIEEGKEQEKINAAFVFAKVFEGVKWAGLYYDQENATKGIEPKLVTQGAAQNMLNQLARAIANITDSKCVYLGRFFFNDVYAVVESKVGEVTKNEA